MSYKCDLCGKASQSGEKLNLVITEKREKDYHYYSIKTRRNSKDEHIVTESKEVAEAPGNKILKRYSSKGWEISKGIKACKRCVHLNTEGKK